ncbi:hypothetical protein NQ318_008376 [Aromia moschata]|uniref:Uncharacterized protein n=1 Tax=Aromia moschata TaxID=1265417 RepID=A0AAV8YGQ8_9CUCU|nr:hypothetical protein NQ318_008376 [Aromia moschata]
MLVQAQSAVAQCAVRLRAYDVTTEYFLDEKDDPEFVPQHVNSYDRPDGQTRRSERVKKPKSYEDYVTFQCQQSINLDEVPIDAADALSTPDADRWRRAMEEEMMSFSENETWELVDAPTSGTVVQCKWTVDSNPKLFLPHLPNACVRWTPYVINS